MTASFPDNAWLTYAEATSRWGVKTRAGQVEYIRHDAEALASSEVAMAMVWAALEEAAGKKFRATVRHDGANVGDLPWLEEFWAVRHEDLRALRPDASAALARMLAEARNDERRRCLGFVDNVAQESHIMADKHGVQICARIAAQISAEGAKG